MPENERPVGTAGNASSSGRTGRRKKASSQIYVLSADGSKLFLLDPSTPEGHEEPPAYHTIHSPASASSSVLPHADTGDDGIRNNPWSSFSANEESIAGPSSPRSVTVHELPSIRSSADIYRTRSASIHGRNRANTTSASRPQRTHFRRTISAGNTPRRAMSVRTQSYGDLGPTDHFEGRATAAAFEANETLPLLQDGGGQPRRGALGSIFCGELEEGDGLGTWGDAWRRFWRPVGSGQYWRAVLHLVVLNFPFALLVWPFLFVGTVAGTVLLITLPLGAGVWWLTLILARSAARLEIILQSSSHLHSHRFSVETYHPIFYRRLDAVSDQPAYRRPADGEGEEDGTEETEVVWETGFVKCSYAMFCDHYSYSSLAYFLLYKPLITLFSSIAVWALLPIGLATIIGLPVYLRAVRRWGRWQAGFALGNL